MKGQCPRPLDDGDDETAITKLIREIGGARRDRTADLLHAMQALSQLSYSPEKVGILADLPFLSRHFTSIRLFYRGNIYVGVAIR